MNRAVYKPNDNVVILLLPAGKVIIDAEDYARIKDYHWYGIAGYVAAQINKKNKPLYLHRLIMNAEVGDRVMFLSNDQFDCRKRNLMHVPKGQSATRRNARKGDGFGYTRVAKRQPFMDQYDPRTGEIVLVGTGPRASVQDEVDDEVAVEEATAAAALEDEETDEQDVAPDEASE